MILLTKKILIGSHLCLGSMCVTISFVQLVEINSGCSSKIDRVKSFLVDICLINLHKSLHKKIISSQCIPRSNTTETPANSSCLTRNSAYSKLSRADAVIVTPGNSYPWSALTNRRCR